MLLSRVDLINFFFRLSLIGPSSLAKLFEIEIKLNLVPFVFPII